MRSFGIVVAALTAAVGTAAYSQQAPSAGADWYVCDTAPGGPAYYPYVQDCSAPWRKVAPVPPAPAPQQGAAVKETYDGDKLWNDRIEHGACSRLHDRYTDSPADEAECDRDFAAEPLCYSYKGFALGWYDMASDPNPDVSSPTNASAALKAMATKSSASQPPYEQSPEFLAMLRRLADVAYSPARQRWATRDQFADYAYKACMDGHPF